MDKDNKIPYQYKPLSMLRYLGYTILFNIPIVGIIAMIIFSFGEKNINLKNFARSYLIIYGLFTVIAIIGTWFALFSFRLA